MFTKLDFFFRCTGWPRQPSELSGCHRGRHGSVYWILGQFPQDLELKIQKFKIIILKRKKKKRQFIFFCPFEISRSVSAKRKKNQCFFTECFQAESSTKKGLQCIYKKSTVSFCKLISQVVPDFSHRKIRKKNVKMIKRPHVQKERPVTSIMERYFFSTPKKYFAFFFLNFFLIFFK